MEVGGGGSLWIAREEKPGNTGMSKAFCNIQLLCASGWSSGSRWEVYQEQRGMPLSHPRPWEFDIWAERRDTNNRASEREPKGENALSGKSLARRRRVGGDEDAKALHQYSSALFVMNVEKCGKTGLFSNILANIELSARQLHVGFACTNFLRLFLVEPLLIQQNLFSFIIIELCPSVCLYVC